VNFSGGQAYVYKIGVRADGNFAQQTPVVIGSNDCGYLEVREGLLPGDRIIMDGLNRIQPNQPIMVVAGPGARAGRPGGMGGPQGKAPQGKAGGPQGAAPPAGASKGPGRAAAPTVVVTSQPGCAPSAPARAAGAPSEGGRRGPPMGVASRGPAGGLAARPQPAAAK